VQESFPKARSCEKLRGSKEFEIIKGKRPTVRIFWRGFVKIPLAVRYAKGVRRLQ
jgi:hypothetical protein